MSYAFISYSTHNKGYAFRLAQALQAQGFDIWIDNNDLRTGDAWWSAITHNLRGCGAFIIIMTPEAEMSKWVQREVHYADDLNKPFFPLLLAGGGWPMFANIHYQDVRNGDLPPSRFYDVLAGAIPRRADGGSNLAGVDTGSIPPVPQPQKKGVSAVFGLAVLGVVLALIIVLIVTFTNTQDAPPVVLGLPDDATTTATATPTDLTSTPAQAAPTPTAYATSTSAHTNLLLGLRHAEQGDYASAISFYQSAIALDPLYVEVFYRRAQAYSGLGDYEAAIADYTQALTLDPTLATAYRERGVVHANLEDYAQALADYSAAIQHQPDFADAFYNRGVLYANLGQYQQAIADYTQVITLNPENALAFNNRGVAYERLRDYSAAIADFEQALALNPNYTLARNNLNRVRDLAGR